MYVITDKEFQLFRRFIFDAAGISLSDSKKTLVTSRLTRRLEARRVATFGDYFRLLAGNKDPVESQIAVDLLTTNETYFFREPRHFEVLREFMQARKPRDGMPRIWSAACSSGEEPYSIAMVLASIPDLPGFEVMGSDLSSRMLENSRRGLYPETRTTNIPHELRRRYCLRGIDQYEGMVLVDPKLRARVTFRQVNLNAPLPALGQFDCVFLRNVMIYFNPETKRQVVERVLGSLKPGGLLFIGHSESLNDISDAVVQKQPSVYWKPLQ
jgi:chemotaxis protein methyltransferase CheR